MLPRVLARHRDPCLGYQCRPTYSCFEHARTFNNDEVLASQSSSSTTISILAQAPLELTIINKLEPYHRVNIMLGMIPPGLDQDYLISYFASSHLSKVHIMLRLIISRQSPSSSYFASSYHRKVLESIHMSFLIRFICHKQLSPFKSLSTQLLNHLRPSCLDLTINQLTYIAINQINHQLKQSSNQIWSKQAFITTMAIL